MRVLHVADAIDPSLGGGTAERTYQLALALERAGIQCSVLCTDLGLGEKRRLELAGVELVAVPTLSVRFLLPVIAWSRIKRLVAQSDVVHVTGHWSVLGALVCLMARRLGKPYVYCPAGSLQIFGRSGFLKRGYNWLAGSRIVREATVCIAVTELERAQFHAYGVPDAKITILPNGVHPNLELAAAPQSFRALHGLGSLPVILFLGRLSPIKGPDLLLEAFAQVARHHPTAHLVFAGPQGELGTSLKAKSVQMGLADRVVFPGFLAGQAKQDALAAANLLVVPSRQEAMSLVALEAGLCGTPVLLTNQCGFDEVQTAGGGLVVEVTAAAIADGLKQMLEHADGLPAMGQRLRELVLSSYTWDGLTQRVLELYASILQQEAKNVARRTGS